MFRHLRKIYPGMPSVKLISEALQKVKGAVEPSWGFQKVPLISWKRTCNKPAIFCWNGANGKQLKMMSRIPKSHKKLQFLELVSEPYLMEEMGKHKPCILPMPFEFIYKVQKCWEWILGNYPGTIPIPSLALHLIPHWRKSKVKKCSLKSSRSHWLQLLVDPMYLVKEHFNKGGSCHGSRCHPLNKNGVVSFGRW